MLRPEDAAGRQILNLSNLSIAVPELLFRPSDAGIKCAGIAEAIAESIGLVPAAIREEMLGNVLVVGGMAAMKGLGERLRQEIQENVGYRVGVRIVEE